MENPESPNPNDQPIRGSGARGRAKKPFDLSERCALFGEAVIRFAKKIPVTPVTKRLIDQLVGAGTGVGGNFEEADDAESRRDFHHKVGICRKESRETEFFLRMVVAAVPELRNEAAELYQEAKELNLIFGSMRRKKPKTPERP